MKQTLNINDNNFKMLFSSCLGNYYPIFIDALGRMKNGEKLEVPFLEEDICDAASLFDYLSNQEDIEGNLFETLYENDDIAIYSDDMCYLSFEEEKRR